MAYRDQFDRPDHRGGHRSDSGSIRLRPLAKLVDPDAPTRKQDIVPFLTRKLAREDVVRRLYESLSDLSKAAVQEALKHPEGRLDSDAIPGQVRLRAGRGQLEVARAPWACSCRWDRPSRRISVRSWRSSCPSPVRWTSPASDGAAGDRAGSRRRLADPAGRNGRADPAPPAAHRGGGLARADDHAPPGRVGQGPGQRQDAEADRGDRAGDRAFARRRGFLRCRGQVGVQGRPRLRT